MGSGREIRFEIYGARSTLENSSKYHASKITIGRFDSHSCSVKMKFIFYSVYTITKQSIHFGVNWVKWNFSELCLRTTRVSNSPRNSNCIFVGFYRSPSIGLHFGVYDGFCLD